MTAGEIVDLIKRRRKDGLPCTVRAIKELVGGGTDRVLKLRTRADEERARESAQRPEMEDNSADELPVDVRRRIEAQEREWARQAARVRATERAAADELVRLTRTEAKESLDQAAMIEAAARSEVVELTDMLADVRARLATVFKSLRAEKKQSRDALRDYLRLQAEVTRLRNDLVSRRAKMTYDGSEQSDNVSTSAHDERRTVDLSADAQAILANGPFVVLGTQPSASASPMRARPAR